MRAVPRLLLDEERERRGGRRRRGKPHVAVQNAVPGAAASLPAVPRRRLAGAEARDDDGAVVVAVRQVPRDALRVEDHELRPLRRRRLQPRQECREVVVVEGFKLPPRLRQGHLLLQRRRRRAVGREGGHHGHGAGPSKRASFFWRVDVAGREGRRVDVQGDGGLAGIVRNAMHAAPVVHVARLRQKRRRARGKELLRQLTVQDFDPARGPGVVVDRRRLPRRPAQQ
mmetsp:Transcript_23287/g.71642  ORF Transcript_23287/g.71642 Transcript_23287/m.71642 type:complete len:227 (-) Transcript_23287:433-1113(-)